MTAKATKSRELKPLPASPKARNAVAGHGICLGPTQCGHKLTLDVRSGTASVAQAATRV